MSPIEIHPFSSAIPVHEDSSCCELISDLSAPEEIPSPPSLTPPDRVASSYSLIQVINGICDLRDKIMDTAAFRLETMKTEIEEASCQLMQKLKETAEQVRHNDFWSMLTKIANCFLSTLSSIFGLSLIGSGSNALIGGALIASGLLAISNLVLSECGGWERIARELAHENEEAQQRLLRLLPMTTGLLAAGFGLVGSVYGITSGALNFVEHAGGLAQTTLTLFVGASRLGKGISDSQLISAQAELEAREEDLKIQREHYETLLNKTEATLNGFNHTFQQAKRAVRTLENTQSQLTR